MHSSRGAGWNVGNFLQTLSHTLNRDLMTALSVMKAISTFDGIFIGIPGHKSGSKVFLSVWLSVVKIHDQESWELGTFGLLSCRSGMSPKLQNFSTRSLPQRWCHFALAARHPRPRLLPSPGVDPPSLRYFLLDHLLILFQMGPGSLNGGFDQS